MAKTIEGIFHPRSLKMRHDMFKTPGVGVGGGGGGATAAGGINNKGAGGAGGGGGPDFLQLQGLAAATVRGKTREEVQKIFVDVLRKVRSHSQRTSTTTTTCFRWCTQRTSSTRHLYCY